MFYYNILVDVSDKMRQFVHLRNFISFKQCFLRLLTFCYVGDTLLFKCLQFTLQDRAGNQPQVDPSVGITYVTVL